MQAQAQKTSQTQLTASQSLACVQTLLKAGLGCITYLRNLLPADNFSESYLMTSGNDPASQSIDSHASFSSDCSSRRNISGFKIMTVTPGFTEEADKLLDFLESGIFDALQKQYLRSFIFAVYLDQQDPNNIVEAYTFNFNYYTPPGSDAAIPIMSLGDDLMNLSLDPSHLKEADPVAEAIKNGKPPTLGEVKRSVKMLVKNLIQATTQMDALPRRRYATFKLFYHDHTPDDYEPPHFRAGDVEKDRWFFATHGKRETPEKCSVGRLETGWHGVDIRIASVSAYLPSAEDNNATFVGTCGPLAKGAPSLTPAEEAATRAHEIELQTRDAEKRCVIWDAEDGLTDMDADGDEDPEYCVGDKGKASKNITEPLGVRNIAGDIVPITKDASENNRNKGKSRVEGEGEALGQCSRRINEAGPVFVGVPETVPSQLGQLNLQRDVQDAGDIPETQPLSCTQAPNDGKSVDIEKDSCPKSPSLPPSDLDDATMTPSSQSQVDTLMLMDNLALAKSGMSDDSGDSEMLSESTDLETQIVPSCSYPRDSVETFGDKDIPIASPERMSMDGKVVEVPDKGLDCECGIPTEDDQCWCDTCGRWYHVWCMGYHSAKDKRLPAKFLCFDCRVRADQNWDLIVVHDLYPSMIAKFKDLALFRRTIKRAEEHDPESLSEFVKIIGVETAVAGQLFKRLEAEGFLEQISDETDDVGLMDTRSRAAKTKGKGKQPKRKNLQKKYYRFVRASKRGSVYQDYFNPDPEVEKRILGLSELRPKHKLRKLRSGETDNAQYGPSIEQAKGPVQAQILPEPLLQSQTQAETQIAAIHGVRDLPDKLKRKLRSGDDQLKNKKVKISVVPGVDLGD